MNKLKTRLILLIMGGSIFAIVLVSFITNFTFFKEFDTYMEDSQEEKVEGLLNMIQRAYTIDNAWSSRALDYINLSPLINNFDLVIRDQEDRIIFQKFLDDSMVDHHNRMMERMDRGMMGRGMGHSTRHGRGMMEGRHNRSQYNSYDPYYNDYNSEGNDSYNGLNNNYTDRMEELARNEDYIKETYVLGTDNLRLATVDIGYMGPFNISERDIGFTRGINKSILYAALISILASIILGLYFSRLFSRPILEITEAANNIRRGELQTIEVKENSILELKELSKSINHLSLSLGEQDQLRKRLTSDISHELRTPLTVLQSHIEALIDGVWQPTEERLNVCKNEVIRLIKLVEQLKYLTDIESHKIELEKENYNLSSDIIETIKAFEYEFMDKGIDLNKRIEDNIYIKGDRDKLKQVVINLLSNALKFTNTGGRVDVVLEKDQEGIGLIISDNGIGIDKKDLPYLFERLYRSDISRNRRTGGSGIGLTITKTLVEAHGGSIRVESEKNKGTRVNVSLPGE